MPFLRGAAMIMSVFGALSCAKPEKLIDLGWQSSALQGGETTVWNYTDEAFTLVVPNLPLDARQAFARGNRAFTATWAASGPGEFVGLGQVFNASSCVECHVRNGRGSLPSTPADEARALVLRLSDRDGHSLHPQYGAQLNNQAAPGGVAEGRFALEWTEVRGTFDDGDAYSLRAPRLVYLDLNLGPLAGARTSLRMSPPVFGLGLLEVIAEEDIIRQADPEDEDGDGVSGRASWIVDETSGRRALGRFGWKASRATVKHQVAGALREDMGLTTRLFPAADQEPEVRDEVLEQLTFYSRMLGVPARNGLGDPAIQLGARLFHDAMCTACHTPTWRTGDADVQALAYQTVHPYTDLLLHDMGEGLADGRPDGEATGQEWRTPPLWGIGMARRVNDTASFLHDGRARTLLEAILWHGGEAERSRARVLGMSAQEREALVAFLDSL